jgi:hypothetical protein
MNITVTQAHSSHATGTWNPGKEHNAYLVWKWVLAEANIPVDAEYLGTSVRGLSRIYVGDIGDMGDMGVCLPGPLQEVRGRWHPPPISWM